jgi:hypothetical protein
VNGAGSAGLFYAGEEKTLAPLYVHGYEGGVPTCGMLVWLTDRRTVRVGAYEVGCGAP